LGATAAQDLFGPKFRITKERGKIFEDTGIAPMVMAALHPTGEVGLVGSAALPQPDSIAANATHTGIRIDIRTDDHTLRRCCGQ